MSYVRVKQINTLEELQKEDWDWLLKEYPKEDLLGLWYQCDDFDRYDPHGGELRKDIKVAAVVHSRLFVEKLKAVEHCTKTYVDENEFL
jgi:hypothetical protein